ncbi:hypothetical protein BDV95DRAFT_604467 [Massariosphaeria phaeospora]|uniref:RING-type domain-containing protein n=1 Tax=Massariosphaeria phaeospora TaxID=100035 RepID=A0A7C8M980_9PLEO|nr:hypothetical protein BDV95DRAFT_604467 [Massariosphaeria phaeospora]
MAPRHLTIDPESDAFNKVVRLEGQVEAVSKALLFRSLYQVEDSDVPQVVIEGVRRYFILLRHLFEKFLRRGLDLANGAQTLDQFVEMINIKYFACMPAARREAAHHWPGIIWFQRLQMLLENQNLSLDQAIIDGWHWFLTPGQYPSRNRGPCVLAWKAMDDVQQHAFLERFRIDESALRKTASGTPVPDLSDPSIQELEARGLRRLFLLHLGIGLDVEHPKVEKPTGWDWSDCLICTVPLVVDEIDTRSEHRPVQTVCGHVFGYACLQKWFDQKKESCPTCRQDFQWTETYQASPEEVLRSADRCLRWSGPPCTFQAGVAPHSALDKFLLVFEPAHEIRRAMLRTGFAAEVMRKERLQLQELEGFVARDRLDAVLKGDVHGYQSAVQLQWQVFARLEWFRFVSSWHPYAPPVEYLQL